MKRRGLETDRSQRNSIRVNRKFLFIRHAAVAVDPAVPAREWSLSSDGRSRTRSLAPQLTPYDLTRIITSDESKARETGQIIAETLGLPWQSAPNLHEHNRQGAPFFTSKEAFETAVARFFDNPDTLVFGNETANQTFARFDTAVRHLLAVYPNDTLAIVTHGTVLTLFLAHYNQFTPFPFWQKLQMPDFFVVTLPDMCL
ncbi:MAG: histidine phosphatase family protein [Ardenticatenaceae bacterium]|nr:histidine phosphatase family protein [Ardenticatenaceae bacterium]